MSISRNKALYEAISILAINYGLESKHFSMSLTQDDYKQKDICEYSFYHKDFKIDVSIKCRIYGELSINISILHIKIRAWVDRNSLKKPLSLVNISYVINKNCRETMKTINSNIAETLKILNSNIEVSTINRNW